MKIRDLLESRHKIWLGHDVCREFFEELETDENDEFLNRAERVITKFLDREVPEPKGVKPIL